MRGKMKEVGKSYILLEFLVFILRAKESPSRVLTKERLNFEKTH